MFALIYDYFDFSYSGTFAENSRCPIIGSGTFEDSALCPTTGGAAYADADAYTVTDVSRSVCEYYCAVFVL